MNYTIIDRPKAKYEAKALLKTAQVPARNMTALFLGICTILSMISISVPSVSLLDLAMGGNLGPLSGMLLAGTFLSILISLMTSVLSVGFILYCMAVRRREQVAYMTLFDGFSFAGKIVGLMIVQFFFTWLWTMLFFFPGIVATYRYRYAFLNLCEHPDCSPMEALELSKKQTMGYKMQLFTLDLSYFGWMFLGQIPTMIMSGILSMQMYGVSSIVLPPLFVQSLIMSLWSLVVALFYLPTYQTTELTYFEISKSTSGANYQQKETETSDSWL